MQPNVGKIFHENTKGREQVSTFHLPVLASMTEGWQRKDTHGCHELVSNGSGVRKTAFLSQQGLGYLESKQPGHSKISHVSNNEPKILWKKPSTTLRHTYVDLMSTYRYLFTLSWSLLFCSCFTWWALAQTLRSSSSYHLWGCCGISLLLSRGPGYWPVFLLSQSVHTSITYLRGWIRSGLWMCFPL